MWFSIKLPPFFESKIHKCMRTRASFHWIVKIKSRKNVAAMKWIPKNVVQLACFHSFDAMHTDIISFYLFDVMIDFNEFPSFILFLIDMKRSINWKELYIKPNGPFEMNSIHIYTFVYLVNTTLNLNIVYNWHKMKWIRL